MEARLKNLLAEKAGQIDIEIVPDHVHLFVKATPVNSLHYIVRQLNFSTPKRGLHLDKSIVSRT